MKDTLLTQINRLKGFKRNIMILGDYSSTRIQIVKALLDGKPSYRNQASGESEDLVDYLRKCKDANQPAVIFNVDKLTADDQFRVKRYLENNQVQVITTAEDLEEAVIRGTFSESLYYQLNTIVISAEKYQWSSKDFEEMTTFKEFDPELPLYALEKQYILSALKKYPNKSECARLLGITIKTLYNKLHEYGEFENHAIHQVR